MKVNSRSRARRTTLFLAALAAVIALFAVPASAGAAQILTEKGEPLEIGQWIQMRSTNVVETHPFGALTCKEVELEGVVVDNGTGSVQIGSNGLESSATGCLVNGALPIIISYTFTDLSATGSGPGTTAFTRDLGICTDESGDTDVTWNGSDVIHVTAVTTGTCGAGNLTGDFTLLSPAPEVFFTD